MPVSFQVGDRVRWRPDMHRGSTWVGTVTGIEGRMAQCDNRGYISFGLLEKVGETMDGCEHCAYTGKQADGETPCPCQDEHKLSGPQMQELADLDQSLHLVTEERDALQAVVIQQCEAMAQMVSATEHAEAMQDQFDAGYEQAQEEAKAELDENWKTLGDYLADVLSELMGTSNPVTLTTCPLPSVRALAEFVRGV